jgi:hypothetical protein
MRDRVSDRSIRILSPRKRVRPERGHDVIGLLSQRIELNDDIAGDRVRAYAAHTVDGADMGFQPVRGLTGPSGQVQAHPPRHRVDNRRRDSVSYSGCAHGLPSRSACRSSLVVSGAAATLRTAPR